MTTPAPIKDAINIALEQVVGKRGKEILAQQGHVASGRGLASFEVVCEFIVAQGRARGELLVNDYLVKLNERQSPSQTRYTIGDLIRWLGYKNRQANLKERTVAAYRIDRAIQREGIPTRGASKFSNYKGGKQIEWVDDTIQDTEKEVERVVFEGMDKYIEFQSQQLARLFQSLNA